MWLTARSVSLATALARAERLDRPSQHRRGARAAIDRRRSGNRTWRTLPALADYLELHLAVCSLDRVGPRQGDELGDAQASGIADLDQNAIAARSRQHAQEGRSRLRLTMRLATERASPCTLTTAPALNCR